MKRSKYPTTSVTRNVAFVGLDFLGGRASSPPRQLDGSLCCLLRAPHRARSTTFVPTPLALKEAYARLLASGIFWTLDAAIGVDFVCSAAIARRATRLRGADIYTP